MSQFDRPAPQAMITLWTLQLNGSHEGKINESIGKVDVELRRIRDDAAARGADLVVFPELVLVGYPPEDLVLRPRLAPRDP